MSKTETTNRTNGFKVGRHFWLHEFRCRCGASNDIHDGFCGGAAMVHPDLIKVLDRIRDRFGRTTIVSGYRCWNYHSLIYAMREKPPTRKSAHLFGFGVDLRCDSEVRYPDDEDFLKSLGITGIGHKDGKIIHVDIYHPRFTIWSY